MKRSCALLALALASSLASAAEMPTLRDVLLDQTWFGDEVTVEDLQGRVVLLEFWGIT
jgi:hypothetical protein